MKKTAEKSTEIGFEEWNSLADDTVRQVKGLRLQLRIAEGILHQARMNRENLRPKEKPNEDRKRPEKDNRPDTATDDVKTHAKQI